MDISESRTERARRAWIERQERFKDEEEEYQRSLTTASPEERKLLSRSFSDLRERHREEDIRMGKRLPGLSVSMHQIMWARWIEVSVEHELDARHAYLEILANPSSDPLLKEFRASLVAVTSAAFTIEAVFGDIKYLIPPLPRRKRHLDLGEAFCTAFGVGEPTDGRLARELKWVFALRDSAAHPYTESVAPARHPAGINTGVEHSQFNAHTSGRAVNTALLVLELAASPPQPSSRWIERWANARAGYHPAIQQLRQDRDREPLPPARE